jgi:surfeit locus 1 family protein
VTEAWEPQIEPRASKPASRSFPIGLTVATAIGIAILVALGVWQLQRLKWKEGLLAQIAALQAAPARPIEPVLDGLSRGRDVDFTRVTADCPGLAAAPFVEMYGIIDGQAGTRLISACEVASARYRTVLVDRGFVPDTVTARPAVDAASKAPMRVIGILRKPERGNLFTPPNKPERWFLRDAAGMARQLHAAAPAPYFMMAETVTNPEFKDLVAAPLPTDIPNRHLEYALTWFGLAGALVGVYAAALFKRMRA